MCQFFDDIECLLCMIYLVQRPRCSVASCVLYMLIYFTGGKNGDMVSYSSNSNTLKVFSKGLTGCTSRCTSNTLLL